MVTTITADVTSLPCSATSSTPSSTPCHGTRRRLAPTRPRSRQVGGLVALLAAGWNRVGRWWGAPVPPAPLLSRCHVGSARGEGRWRGEALHLLQEQQALHHGDAHQGAGRCAAPGGSGERVCPTAALMGCPPILLHSHRCRMAMTLTPMSRPTCCPTPKKQPRGKPKWPEKPATPPTMRWYVGWGWG